MKGEVNEAAQAVVMAYRQLLEMTRAWNAIGYAPREALTEHFTQKTLLISTAALELQRHLGISFLAANARILAQLVRDGDASSQYVLECAMRDIECEGRA